MALKIKDEFKKLIPALSQEEYDQLEQNCINEGIRDAICVWDGYIIDGHNRYEIALKHELNYDVEEMQFDSEEDVIIWMCENQLGRRNLEPIDKQPLMERIEEIEAGKAKERMSLGGINKGVKNFTHLSGKKTRDKIAEKMGVSGPTYDALKKVNKEGTDDLKDQVRQKKVGASTAAVITELPKEEQDEVVAKGTKEILEMAKKIRAEKREIQLQKRKEIHETLEKQQLTLTGKKYRIIYADPPWKYNNEMPEYVTEPQDYYLLMNTDEIKAMKIKDITDDDAVLFLWSTSPHLPEALDVLKAWGFKYKTTFIWDKIKHNMGHYNSVRHEILLVATKGVCTPDVKKLFNSVVRIERTEHSKKPEYFREIIETLYTYGNKIELFSRDKKDGWDVFGNQIDQ